MRMPGLADDLHITFVADGHEIGGTTVPFIAIDMMNRQLSAVRLGGRATSPTTMIVPGSDMLLETRAKFTRVGLIAHAVDITRMFRPKSSPRDRSDMFIAKPVVADSRTEWIARPITGPDKDLPTTFARSDNRILADTGQSCPGFIGTCVAAETARAVGQERDGAFLASPFPLPFGLSQKTGSRAKRGALAVRLENVPAADAGESPLSVHRANYSLAIA